MSNKKTMKMCSSLLLVLLSALPMVARAQEASPIHHREHNLLLDAKHSGNMDSFNVGLRRFDGGACQPKFLVYDFKKQDVPGFSGWVHHKHKRLARKTDWCAYGVAKDANLGVVSENNAAYWMAEWEAPVSANFITLMGSYPDESSQANTAWKIELLGNGTWRVHAQGVGGWYDRGQYFSGAVGDRAQSSSMLCESNCIAETERRA